jgi:transposase
VLKSWGEATLSQINEVSIDLSVSYKGLIKKVLPNADIVADRVHVMKLINRRFKSEVQHLEFFQ